MFLSCEPADDMHIAAHLCVGLRVCVCVCVCVLRTICCPYKDLQYYFFIQDSFQEHAYINPRFIFLGVQIVQTIKNKPKFDLNIKSWTAIYDFPVANNNKNESFVSGNIPITGW